MGWLFGDAAKLIEECDELKKDIRKLKEEKMDLEYEKKKEIEEIKHLNRLAQEKRDIELEREKVKLSDEYAKKVEKLNEDQAEKLAEALTKYHEKVVSLLQDHNKDMKEVTTSVYKDIIARLPNVNVTMKR